MHTHAHTLSVNTQRWISLSLEPRAVTAAGWGWDLSGEHLPADSSPCFLPELAQRGEETEGGVLPCPGPWGLPAQLPPNAADPSTSAWPQTKTPQPEQPPGPPAAPGGVPFCSWRTLGSVSAWPGVDHPRSLGEAAVSPAGEARMEWAHQSAFLGPSVQPPPPRAQSCRGDGASEAASFQVPAGHEAQPIGVRASSPRSQALNSKLWDLSSGAPPRPAAPPSPLQGPAWGCQGPILRNPSPPFPTGSPQAISFPPGGSGPLQGCGEQAPVTPCPSEATCLAEGVPRLQACRAAGPVDGQVGWAVSGRPAPTSSDPAFGAPGSGAPHGRVGFTALAQVPLGDAFQNCPCAGRQVWLKGSRESD